MLTFRLRTLLVAICVLALGFHLYGLRYRRWQVEVAGAQALRSIGATVAFGNTVPGLPHVYAVRIQGSRVSCEHLESLTNFPSLTELSLSGCGIGDDDVRSIARLRTLDSL